MSLSRTCAALAVAASALACGKAREISSGAATATCTRCHGGLDDQSGAPPFDARGGSDTALVTVGAHTAHVGRAGLDCVFCHVKPAAVNDAGHMVGRPAPVTGYTGEDPAWLAAGGDPGWSEASATCSTAYCHGAFDGGNRDNAPVWTRVGERQADCGTCHGDAAQGSALPRSFHPALAAASNAACAVCHPASVSEQGALIAGGPHVNGVVDTDDSARHPAGWYLPPDRSPTGGAHGLAAAQDPTPCLRCHSARAPASVVALTCASCHESAGQDWTAACTGCHGSETNPAPPRDTLGRTETTLASVGAHQAHVTGASGLAAPLDCAYCHVRPANVFAAGHLDGTVTVTGFTGGGPTGPGAADAGDPGWNAATASCATAYCHGAFPGGNAANAPVWTRVGDHQADCGTCHGLPPPPPHPAVSGDLAMCGGCHAETTDAAGNVIPPRLGGKHLDGQVEAAGHPASWMDPASPGFHAFSANLGLGSCTACHGADLSGGAVFLGCGSCHDAALPAGVTTWAGNCFMCHGDDQAHSNGGAPPRATWGHAGDPDRGGGTADPVRVGAHQKHAGGGAIGGPFDCSVCHVKPQSALSPDHVDRPTATVTFAGLAVSNLSVPPAWERAGATCAGTYCHGATLAGGSTRTPVWTLTDGTQETCGSCHGAPPPAPHPSVPGSPAVCATCHPDTVRSTGAIKPAGEGGLHVDGTVQWTDAHAAAWMDPASDSFHAFSANSGLSVCQQCHGSDLSGGFTGVACASCHRAGGAAASADFSTCTGCHGGTNDATGAPPRPTWRNADPLAVGAHGSHVTGTALDVSFVKTFSLPFDCVACHEKPADMLSAGHVDGTVQVTGYTGTDPDLLAAVLDPGWTVPAPPDASNASCATSYCHGATLPGGSNTAPVWTRLDGTQAACGTCHGMPPDDGTQADGSLVFGMSAHRYHVSTRHLACQTCHAGYAWGGTGNSGNAVNPQLHVNGVRDVNGVDGSVLVGWDCTGCHATRTY